MSIITLQEQIVHYEVLGRGRPLIFLHGWVGSWRYWIPSMQAASVSFRTYAVDLWGFGDTARNTAGYSLEQQTNLLDQFLQELGIGKVALIGHGLGAVVALLFAARYTKNVDRVMAVGLPNGNGSLNPRLLASSPSDLAEWLLGRTLASDVARQDAPKADPQAIQLSLAELPGADPGSLPSRLTTPCLVVYGQNDPAIGLPLPEAAFALPEHVHQIVFEQSGHFPMLDETNKFHRLMADFLALNSGVSPRQLQLKEEWKRRVR